MASNVFPMLSSSPPPIDDCPDDEDDDDEFGNFRSANIPFDSSFDSPVKVDKFKSFKSGNNGENDSNFTDELHKFNSFTNSETPSPQDFVPNFSDENEERCKNGFKPIKREKCKISTIDFDKSSNEDNASCQIEVTSHKPLSVKIDRILDSSNSSKLLASENSDSDQNSTLENLVVNHIGNEVSKINEKNSFEEESSVCDSLTDKVTKHLNLKCEEKGEECKNFSSEAASDINFSKINADIDKMSLNHDNNIPDDEFACDFQNCEDSYKELDNCQETENISDNFEHSEKFPNDFLQSEQFPCDFQPSEQFPCDFQQSEQLPRSFQQLEQFPCDFEEPENFNKEIQESENCDFQESDQFPCDFQQAEIFPCDFPTNSENVSSNLKSADNNISGMSNESEEVLKSRSENLPISENSDEFDDFQVCEGPTTSAPVAENDDFEFDDFQDFQGSTIPTEEVDEFADFQDFSAAGPAGTTDDFADFSAAPFDSNNKRESSEASEFADFEEASFNPSSESSFQASSTSQKSGDTLSAVINAIFPLSDSPDNSEISDETSPQILEQTNKSRRLWEKLHEVEQTPGLRFQWGISHSFQQLLRSVNVDYHSILRTSSVPIFASGLSLLEPVKGLSSLANNESEDRNLTPKDPIPPVEFDWNSSGLVNPLELGQVSSTLMDLSFLSSVETNSNMTNNDHSFENELLKPSPALAPSESTSKTQILEQLLSKNISSLPNSKLTHRPSDLSDEAVRVLDQLPDLSFMQAKVLMFPISSKT